MFHAAHGYERASGPEVKEPGTTPENRVATAVAPATSDLKSAARAAGKATGRDAYFDNAKYLAIVLVAVAHAWEPVMEGSRATRALYMVIYTFHMPAFIIISGYFSRSYRGKPHQLRRLLTGIALPYVVFEVAYSLFARYADDPSKPISLLDPFYLTWFLAALFVWRLTTPLWQTVRWPMSIALAICVLASLTPDIGADFNLARVLQFLPFFVLGLCLKPEHFQMLRRREVRLLAVPVIAGALLFAYWAAPRVNLSWFYRSRSVQERGWPWWSGLVVVLVLLACALVLSAAFLALVPARRAWFTMLGAGTICGYLLHGFAVRAGDYSGLFESQEWLGGPAGLVVLTLATAGMVTLMCTPPVRRALRFVTEPDMKWAFRQDPAERGPRR
ncbi:acyltransferase family protein [Streptomyces peucetius]|uniref:Acyltransferase family protein n=1 Tax=Streptomyces peucetius TaxID=1950 RepID=A0ABY6I550_STRPE|nr:acyltransferase family protein [Streptomyces peucetius]UYQ62128.1 acyltransferase family protein [Streptomyces peucetius]